MHIFPQKMRERFFVLDGKCLRYYSTPKVGAESA